ncbi:VOC family protein [Uliginosibacterium sp. sgz301328]|uniref:VOC family protein n=1 Tax=Uliginosibacterium sp. sgz301328 TaxID=3243764 RepID=UPI00359EE1BA
MRNALNWFEIPATDFQRARGFYQTILDVDMPIESMPNCRLALFPYREPGVGGAVVEMDKMKPGQDGVKVYLNGGNDMRPILDRIEDAGGKIMLPRQQISPEIGYIALFADTEGNLIGLHSPN